MTALSPAASGQKRGVLELLKEPPSLATCMDTSPMGRHASTVSTYSSLAFIISSTIAVMAATDMMIGIFAFVAAISGGIALVSFLASVMDDKKEEVIKALKKAASVAVEKEEQVSVSYYVNEEIHHPWESHTYVDSLSPKQQRWLMKRWEKELEAATQREIAPSSSFSYQLDSMVTEDKLRQIEYHRKAIAELEQENSHDVNTPEGFMKKLNETVR